MLLVATLLNQQSAQLKELNSTLVKEHYMRSICRQQVFCSLRAHQRSSDQMKIYIILGHSQGDSLANLKVTRPLGFVHIQPEGHQEPCEEVGSLSLAECLAGFELGTFRFLLQCHNPLYHSPQILARPYSSDKFVNINL